MYSSRKCCEKVVIGRSLICVLIIRRGRGDLPSWQLRSDLIFRRARPSTRPCSGWRYHEPETRLTRFVMAGGCRRLGRPFQYMFQEGIARCSRRTRDFRSSVEGYSVVAETGCRDPEFSMLKYTSDIVDDVERKWRTPEVKSRMEIWL